MKTILIGFMAQRRIITILSLLAVLWAVSGCCSFVIPQISLTGNKTAIERQIMGEQTELEKDIWMISSSRAIKDRQKSDGERGELEKREAENAKINEGFAIIDAFSANLELLKKDRVVGENNQGFIANLFEAKDVSFEEATKKKYDPALKDDRVRGLPYRMLIETVAQMNQARELLITGYIERQKALEPKFVADRKKILEEQRRKFHDEALKGEYIQDNQNRWLPK